MVSDNLLGAGFAGAMLAVIVVVMVIGLIFYLFAAFAMMAMAKKRKIDNGWLAFIPIANIYLMTQIADLEWFWMLGFLIGLIPILGPILGVVWVVYIWWKIAEALKKPGWWGVLMLVPLANLVVVYLLAWGK